MLSPKRSTISNLAIDRSKVGSFIALNQEGFDFLLAFVRMSREGMVAQELRQWEQVRTNYLQALAIFEEFNEG
jgi:hypothetical protein